MHVNTAAAIDVQGRVLAVVEFDKAQTVVLPAAGVRLYQIEIVRKSPPQLRDQAPRQNLFELTVRFHGLVSAGLLPQGDAELKAGTLSNLPLAEMRP
jgi:hypothetical protein